MSTPVVAYVDGTGRVLCPAHWDHARGEAIPQTYDNSAMDDERCDVPGCGRPIAAEMLAARAARFRHQCHWCRTYPAQPCLDHRTSVDEHLAALNGINLEENR